MVGEEMRNAFFERQTVNREVRRLLRSSGSGKGELGRAVGKLAMDSRYFDCLCAQLKCPTWSKSLEQSESEDAVDVLLDLCFVKWLFEDFNTGQGLFRQSAD